MLLTQTVVNSSIKVGFLTISDRAFNKEYKDLSGPAMQAWVNKALLSPFDSHPKIVPDEQAFIQETLIKLSDDLQCNLILTSGGTGPTPRDITPEATRAVCERVYDGFAEAMRDASLKTVPTAILSRQIAGTRGKCLMINLPGKPDAIAVCLSAVFLAVPKCLDLLSGVKININKDFVTEGLRPDH